MNWFGLLFVDSESMRSIYSKDISMPQMGSAPKGRALAKLLLIGDGKIGKSYYAAMAAKAGFNVVYFDGDVGQATISSMIEDGVLTQVEADRIYLFDMRDTIMGGLRDTKFFESMNEFMSNIKFRWNDDKQRIAKRGDTDAIWELTPGLMDSTVVWVLDSWTGYAESVMLAVGRVNNVNVGDATTSQMRPVYQGGGLKSSEALQVIRSMPCHVIAIGHTDEYQKTTLKDGTNKGEAKEKDQEVEWTKLIPKSTSKPQGFSMPKYFTDVAWMELSPAGNERRLNFKPSNDRVGGGHFTESKSTEVYSFENLVKKIGGTIPDGKQPTPWLKIIPAGAEPEPTTESKVLDGSKPTPVKGLSGLFGKPNAAG